MKFRNSSTTPSNLEPLFDFCFKHPTPDMLRRLVSLYAACEAAWLCGSPALRELLKDSTLVAFDDFMEFLTLRLY
jgi:hypothetical protein